MLAGLLRPLTLLTAYAVFVWYPWRETTADEKALKVRGKGVGEAFERYVVGKSHSAYCITTRFTVRLSEVRTEHPPNPSLFSCLIGSLRSPQHPRVLGAGRRS